MSVCFLAIFILASLTTQPARDLTNYFKFVVIMTIFAYNNLTNLTSTPLVFQDTYVVSTPTIPETPVTAYIWYFITSLSDHSRSAENIFVVDMSRMIIGNIKTSILVRIESDFGIKRLIYVGF